MFDETRDKILSNLARQKSYRLKVRLPEIFDKAEFKASLAFAFEGLEELTAAGWEHGVNVINLFGEGEGNILTLNKPSLETFQALTRAQTSFAIDGITEETAKQLRKFTLGSTNINDITKQVQQAGILKPSRARMIARTESAHLLGRGQLTAWEASEVVTAKIWYTALDERVCPWCSQYHGRRVGLADNFAVQGEQITGTLPNGRETTLEVYEDVPTEPLHPNCRCTLIPEIE